MTLESLKARGVFDDREDAPTYTTIHTKRKAKFCTPKALNVFDQDDIADFTAVARGRIISAFVQQTSPHRGKHKPQGYITGVDRKLGELVDYVTHVQDDNPFIRAYHLPEELQKLTSGKLRIVVKSLTREFVEMAMQPLAKQLDVWFMSQNGGEWHISPSCKDELPVVKYIPKLKLVEEPAAS